MPAFPSLVSAVASTATLLMLSAPIQTVLRLEANGSIGVMTVTFFCCQLANCISWSMYGVLRNSTGRIISNAVGTSIATYCILTFMGVARREEGSGRKLASTTYKRIVQTVIATIIILTICTSMVLSMITFVGYKKATVVGGVLGGSCSVIMLSSPLMMATMIIQKKDATGLAPLTMSFAMAHSSLWTLYGWLILDFFVIVPNTLGAIATAFQFFLLFKYGRSEAAPVIIHEAVADVPALGLGNVSASSSFSLASYEVSGMRQFAEKTVDGGAEEEDEEWSGEEGEYASDEEYSSGDAATDQFNQSTASDKTQEFCNSPLVSEDSKAAR